MTCKSNRGAKAAVLVLATAPFILTLTLNYLSSLYRQIGILPKNNSGTILPRSQQNRNRLSESSSFEPSPFNIWFVIFLYHALTIGYCWSTLFRRAFAGGPFLCSEIDVAPNGMLVWFGISSASGVTWTVLAEWSSKSIVLLIPQTAVLFVYTLSLHISLIYSYRKLYGEKEKLINYNKQLEYWLVVALVQNGVAMYATWCTIASFFTLYAALVINTGADQVGAAIGCLIAVFFVVFAYAIFDLTMLDPITRYVFTPHLVVIWACAASLTGNVKDDSVLTTALTIMIVVFLVSFVLLFIAKLIGIVIRRRSKPILTSNTADQMLIS